MIKSSKSKFNLLSYSHDRMANYKITADEIFNHINKFTNQEELDDIYYYFESKYNLPKDVIKQTLRQFIARSYILKKNKFNSNLNLINIPKSIIGYGALIYALFFIKIKKKIKNYKLIIDNITSSLELNRFEKLLNLVGDDKVLCVIKDSSIKKNFPKYQFYNRRPFRNINIFDLLKTIFKEFFIGIWIILKASIKTRVNLFPVSLRVVHNYLYFKSFLESNKADFIIQGKHYDTEPIKNYLFKRYGGIASTSIQKNIIQLDPFFFYLDLDILFSLGNDGCNRLYKYGGRIGNILPVGSLFMEYQWFSKKIIFKKKFDIAVLGINTSSAYNRLDSYDKFMDDYYCLYNWITKLSNENPQYNIVLIHHASSRDDKIQDKILSGSNVKVLDKNMNSYEVAFSSKLSITYGSTMGYELNAHNLPTFFIDPGKRCTFLPDEGSHYIDRMRIHSYETLNTIVKQIINKETDHNKGIEKLDNLCLESSEVSNKIYDYIRKKANDRKN